nr:DUF6502 family protein [Roseicella frigidaeris]
MTSSPERPTAEALVGPLRRMLRPLVRFLIQCGVTFPVLAELLRGLYLDVARAELPGSPPRTDSRVSLITGIHRKEVRRHRGATGPEEAPAVVTLGSQIIARWLGDPAFAGPDGAPRALARLRVPGEPSFEALVEAVTSDMRPRAVLDEWLSLGLVSLGADDRVTLDATAFLPRPGQEAQLFYFARNLGDHLAAATANVAAAARPPFIDRSVHYDRLDPAVAAALEAVAREAAERVLVEVNRQALGMVGEEAPAAGPRPTRRVNLGVYLYVEDEPPDEAR